MDTQECFQRWQIMMLVRLWVLNFIDGLNIQEVVELTNDGVPIFPNKKY